eukprot:GILK01001314.1.p1 GENE.GILK01001314.1~~GILK01001314.1.p1  ORF type:complete len:882 (-),score=172.35 GILK01001314.1:53-2698(-)
MAGGEPENKKQASLVDVPSSNKEKKKDDKSKKDEKKEELSEEDLEKKANLDMLAERARDPDQNIAKFAIETIKTELRTATSSMTSVPKPLKFLRPHYPALKTHYEQLPSGDLKNAFADILSVMAMTMATEGSLESLQFRLAAKSSESITVWGHEYLRHLSGEISKQWKTKTEANEDVADLLSLVNEIVPFNMHHNAETEAVDLLLEIDQLELLVQHSDKNNSARVCNYLTSCAAYAADPEEMSKCYMCTFKIYMKQQQYPEALRIALKADDMDAVRDAMESCQDRSQQKQMAFLLARHRVQYTTADEQLSHIISNEHLSEHFLMLARDLDVMEAKTPDDIYKSHLEEKGRAGVSQQAHLDSAKQNLASTFVNAFVNAGYGKDLLMTPEGNAWLYKNKEHGMMSATASMGMILQWDVDGGLTQIDKFQYSGEDYIKAGALLAFGIVNSGVRNECDPALALLSEHLESNSDMLRIGAISGLGLAYAGSAREDVLELLTPLVVDTSGSLESSALAALSLGLIFVGTRNEDIAQAILQTMMERGEAQLNMSHSRFFALGLGLLFLGQQDKADATLEATKVLSHPIQKMVEVTVQTCAYACSGNVLKVQHMLHLCADHLEEKDAGHQMVAVLGLALIAMGEDIGADMCLRSMDHLLQYGELPIRRAVPLSLGLLSVSNPRVTVMDTLSKLSHDIDQEVAQNAIFALGLIGAGTNNSRLGGLLRQLAAYYQKEPNVLFVVRVAQGMLHMGKGLVSLSPMHSDRLLVSNVALGGLLVVLHSCLDMKNIILGKSHYMLYYLVCAMYPRMLITLDENLKPLPVSVRVGQAVDTVGQAGKPKTITGFQTHTTPVLLGHGDRAELATDEYIPVTSLLENFVILKKNPEFRAE